MREVELALEQSEVRVFVEVGSRATLRCPTCGAECPGYDARERCWRHLDTMQYRTIVIGRVPRVECPEHGVMLYVADDRKQESLEAFYEGLGRAGCAQIATMVMDMWAPYIASTRAHVPNAETKIVFDEFHVAKHLGNTVNRVRREENRALRAEGDERLVKTKYLWLRNPDRMSGPHWREFAPLRSSRLRVARPGRSRSRRCSCGAT